ncbi:unnamed protein product [Periconia digitata]|uniref:Trehalose synthase n=1 Tax=Periconia digitata TaxID=1303443 RepID=A0A9W4UCE8_9PLEO|nr:unnamed protein product [Periconia digitata]
MSLHNSITGAHKSRRPSRPAQLREHTRKSFYDDSSIQNVKAKKQDGTGVQRLYVGVAVQDAPNKALVISAAFHDGTYGADSETLTIDAIPDEEREEKLCELIIKKLKAYRRERLYKFVGAGVNARAYQYSPHLLSQLWKRLDIVPCVYDNQPQSMTPGAFKRPEDVSVDEEADQLARKAFKNFNPTGEPHLQIGHRNRVKVDSGGEAIICHADEYPGTVKERTWQATIRYAQSLRDGNIKIAFFNSTPQGGGVALMRHALIRFLHTLDVDANWYVPNPKPAVFRITKNNHNILQGVAEPDLRINASNIYDLDEWCTKNASRFWTSQNCPLGPRSEGGSDVIIVDDPQMPGLVKIAKAQDPSRPVIFRSHIQVRADLANKPGTPTAEVWDWIWENVKDADLFISHPVPDFVPANVTPHKVGYMPATTDWLDGLNKDLSDWDLQFFQHEFNAECLKAGMYKLDYPARKYIVQIARFDPAKGIADVLASYAELRRVHMKDWKKEDSPQLVVAGHGAIDDPDATHIHRETLEALSSQYADIKDDVIVMRLGPSDQLLNFLMSSAHVALQLSTREGFEVKVSEALHKGVPIIATRRGGIPLQVEKGKSGFLVEAGDYKSVARHLFELFTNEESYAAMADYAKTHVSDEVSTVGNALCWLYMADRLAKGESLGPESRWINDMARETAGLPYLEDETKLPRVLE